MVMLTPATSTSMRLTASPLSLAAIGGAVPTICHLSSSVASPLALAAGPLRGDDERRWQHRMGMTLLTDYYGAAVTGGSRIELNQNGASGLSSRVPALDQVLRLESLVIFIVVGRWWAADGNWRVLAAGHGLWVVGR